MVVDESDEQNQRIEGERRKLLARQQSDLAKVLGMAEGRRVVWRVMSLAKVFALSYAGEAGWQTNFNEGQRSVGVELLKDIPPETMLIMQRESANDKLLRDPEPKEKPDGQ